MRSVSSLRRPIVLLAAAAGIVALGISVARVPGAADGARAELDIDPQAMVRPQAVTVRVQFPTGFRIGPLPAGWRPAGRSAATWVVDALDESPRLALSAKGPARTP